MANHEAQLLNISRTSLLCSMCHERFKEPKLLECLHNFCQKCLATTTKSSGALGGSCSIQCPLCNKQTEIPNSNVANLKTNFPLVRLIDTIRVQEQVLQSGSPVSKAVICGTCDQKNKAVSRCHDCSMFLCRSCQTVHRRIAACSHHTVTLLDDLLSGKQTPVLKKQQGRAECIKHPGCKDRSDVYCETCKKQLCKECAVLKLERGRHGIPGTCTSSHRHIRVETAAANKRSSIKNMISGLQQKLTDFKSTAKTIATSGPELDSRAAKLEQQVKNFANKARVDICIEEASLLKKISQIRQDQAKTLEDCGARINTAMDHMIDATEAAMEIVDNSEDGDFLMLWPLVEKGLHNQMSIRPSDIYQGLSHWTFQENRSINLGTLSDSSGYSYGKGMNTARQGLFDQMQRTMKNDTPFGAAVFPTKEGAASETGVFKDLIERFPPPPNGDISSSQQETSGKKTSGKMLKSQGKSCCREKSSTFDFGASASDSSAIFQSEYLSLWNFKTEMKDEEIMYKQQACMYRYETFSGIWKERGIGNIKLLRHKDRGVLRLIFQLERESKVCANHYIYTLMKLEPLESSRRFWLWRATDHSEGLSCNQQFAAKFKTSELAKEFKSRLKELQAARKVEEEKQFKRTPSTFTRGVTDQESSEPNDDMQVTSSGPTSAPATIPSKQASNKDVASKSPLLVSMLMKQDEKSAVVPSTKIGSVTAGTPPQSFLSSSSKPSVVAPDNSTVKSKDLGTTSAKLGLFHDNQVSQPEAVFGSNQRQASSEHDPTSATTSASAALANFSFKSSKPSPANFTQTKPSPVTPAFAPDKTTSQSPFAGFGFGQLSTVSGTVSSGFTFSGATTSQASTFESVTKPGSQHKENDFGEDDVIFVSEKIPTADQRARAEVLFLPPTFFLYEDEPPCPGCPGCDPEDLAARGKSPAKSFQPEAAESSQSQAPVFGSTASAQMTFADMSKMALSVDTKETPITAGMPESSLPSSSVFGAAGGSSSLSFASIRAGKQGTFAGASRKGFTFAQAGAPVFGAATKEEDGEQESHKHDPHYEPIMSLPELSQVKTGEEEEEVMYKQRARLYRYAKELGVWKERGIGDVKLLRHKHSGVLRLIMRREQVLKLCANHRITTDMKLDPLHSSDRSWVWHAVDYSEDEPCHEQLAIRFKTSEQAHEFKRRLEELQAVRKEEEEREMEQKTEASGPKEEVGETKPEGEEIKKEDSAGASDEPDQETTTEDNFAKFQPKEGDWKCEICWLNNGKGDMACVACMTPKPGAVSSTTAPASGTVNLLGATAQTGKASSSGGNLKFTFGSASGSSFAFGSSKSSDGTAKPSGFKFGGPVALSSATPLSTPRSSLSTETVKFGATQSNTTLTIAKESTQAKIAPTTKFTFGSGFQKFDFGGAGDKATKPKIPENSLSGGYTFDTVGAQKVDGAGAATLVAAASSEVQVTPVKPSTGFVFGAKSITPPTTKPSEAKPEAYLFADMVKPEGATFSFCLDVSKSLLMSSEKSPVKPKSPGLNKSPGFNKSGDSEYYKDDEGEEQLTPLKSSVGPSIGAKSVISMCTTKPSKEQHKQLSFADMAKVEGSAFAFRLDICKSLEMSSGMLPFKPRTLDYIQSVPIIKLPICIQIKTGEENETTKFSHRAQLYCFDKDSSQWKERGIGDIKLLYNPANGKYRIVMRREKVLKLCANHYVTPILNLQSNAASTKSWVWMAMDASDEEAQMKQLAVRFKAEEVALQFKKAVDAAKKDIMAEKGGQTDEKKDDKEEVGDEAIERQDKEEGPDDSLGERGDIDQQEGDSDGNEDVDNDDDNDEDVDETEEEEGEDQGEHDEEEERQEAVEEGDANLSIVKSCDPNISKAFSELLRTSITSHAEELKLGVETPTTSTSSTSKHGDAGERSKDDSISEERDDIHCEAVAQLPKQVDVITGEEDETELFCSRAKLYRFDKAAAQWKDRGIGDIKILGNTTMKRYRVIMRRDQVLKLCANHYITAEMTLEPNAGSENSLVWQAMDASEGDPQMEELAVRFKLAGTTQRFKTVFEECQAELRKQRQQDDGVSSTSVESQGASVKEQKDESRDDEKASSSPTSETEKPSSESSSTSESSKTESEN